MPLKLNLREAALTVAAAKSKGVYMPSRPTRKRMNKLRRQFRGFSKISTVLDAAFNKQTSGSPTVHESLRRLFERVMRLKSPHEMHIRLEASGKRNWVPQRYLLAPPSSKGKVHGKAHTALGNQESTSFDNAAQKVATAFGNNSEEQVRMQNLLQIFSYYSSLQDNGFRTLAYEDFLRLISDVQLEKRTDYRSSDKLLCWRAFCRSKTGLDDPNTTTRRINFQTFVEGFGLIAQFVFRTSSKPPSELTEIFIADHILPYANRVRSDPLTLALLWNEDSQKIFRNYEWPLQIIFRHFASLYEDAADTSYAVHTSNGDVTKGSNNTDPISKELAHKRNIIAKWSTPLSGNDTMDWQEFLKLLRCFYVVGSRADQLTEKHARKVFDEANLSELSDTDVDRLSWHEYLEALGRCALMLFPLETPDTDKKNSLENKQVKVQFQPVAAMKLTVGLKSAVSTIFQNSGLVGKDCFAPDGQPIVRQLSPRQRRSAGRSWRLREQKPLGSLPWIALGKPASSESWKGSQILKGTKKTFKI